MSPKKTGRFIVIDGIDGTGKTTQLHILGEALRQAGHDFILTNEPTGTVVGQALRCLLKDKSSHPLTDALMFTADRHQHCMNIIDPTLVLGGKFVLCDRYYESTIAYQTVQMEKWLNNRDDAPTWMARLRSIFDMNTMWTTRPDLTLILDCTPAAAIARMGNKDKEKFEAEDFLQRARKIFLMRAQTLGYTVINAASDKSTVASRIMDVVNARFGLTLEVPRCAWG